VAFDAALLSEADVYRLVVEHGKRLRRDTARACGAVPAE
jgi:hypothetical protein